MKNHVRVNGQLLQTNKTFRQLKQRQKEKIYDWMFDAYHNQYLASAAAGAQVPSKETDAGGQEHDPGACGSYGIRAGKHDHFPVSAWLYLNGQTKADKES